LAGASELRVLRQEAVAGVDGVGPGFLGHIYDLVDAEITILGWSRADMVGLIGVADVQRRTVHIGVDRGRLHAQLPTGAEHPDGYLTSIGD